MHEFAIAEHLVSTVEEAARQAGAERVFKVHLALGVRSHVELESLQWFYDHLSQDGPANGAVLVSQPLPMRFHCDSCKLEYSVTDETLNCPSCHGLGKLVDAGDDMRIDSLEVGP